MTAQAGKFLASLLMKVWTLLSLRADLQVPWPESASELVAPSQKEVTKAGWRKCRGKIVFPPSYRVLKFVIWLIMDFLGRQGLWRKGVVVGVAVGVGGKRGGLSSKNIGLGHLIWRRRWGCGSLWIPTDGNVNLQLQPSSNLLDAGRRRQEDKKGDPSVLPPLANRV